jgi:endonuclease-3
MMNQQVTSSRCDVVCQELSGLYGEPIWHPQQPPMEVLVSAILSQNTNDANRDVAFDRLRSRYGTWEAVRDAPTAEVVEAIRPAGLANQKGPRIQNALRALDHGGSPSLDLIASMPLEQAREWLMALPGVGPKTAAIVLLFGLGRPAFPVDTHVHRVTRRLGLIPPGTSAEKAHVVLEQAVRPEHYYAFHLNLIRHGRRVCRARRPRCQECHLRSHCDFYRQAARSDED